MGQVANQMVIEMFFKMKQSIQNKRDQKKESRQVKRAEKGYDRKQ